MRNGGNGYPHRLGITACAAVIVFVALCPGFAEAVTFPASCSVGVGDPASLVAAINSANATAGADTVALASGCTYTLAAVDNSWFGQNGLPAIAGQVTIEGNGATIARDPAAPPFRFFFVGADPANPSTDGYVSPGPGALTLRNVTVRGGLAQGGDSLAGSGGGAGMGGAIFSQGAVTIAGSALTANTAIGGSSTVGSGALGGGGMGAGSTGGFGGSVSGGGSGGSGGGGAGFRTSESGSPGSTNGAGAAVATGTGGKGADQAVAGGAAGDGSGGGGGAGSGPSEGVGGAFGQAGAGLSAGGAGGGGGGGVGGGGGSGQFQIDTPTLGGPGGGGGFGGGGGRGGRGGTPINPGLGGGNGGNGGNGGFGGGGGGAGSGGSGSPPGTPGTPGAPGFGGGTPNGLYGGSGAGMGGAVFNMQGTLDVRDSTLTANVAHGGADDPSVTDDGKGLGGAVFNLSGAFTAAGSTFAANTADFDGGSIYNLVYDGHTARTAQVVLRNTIVANDVSATDLASNKTAYITPGPLGTADASIGEFDIVGASAAREAGTISGTALTSDPRLDPGGLADNGGLAPTIALEPGSPAIDAGHAFAGETTDQRGAPRPADLPDIPNAAGGDGADIGAFEAQPDPETTIDSGPTDGAVVNSPPTFGFTSNVGGATFSCSVDDASFVACSSPMAVSGLADGDHSFAVLSADQWRGIDTTPASRTFTIDSTPPDTAIATHPKPKVRLHRHHKRVEASFEFSSSEAGSSFACRIDAEPLDACASPVAYKLKKGEHTFSVLATDRAGNPDPTAATFELKVKASKHRHHHHRHH